MSNFLAYDWCHFFLMDGKQNIIDRQRKVCFAGMPRILEEHVGLKVKFFGNCFISNLTEKQTTKYINTFKKLGLFENVQVKILGEYNNNYLTNILKPAIEKINSKCKVIIWADINVCSYQEYKAVGFIIRNITNAPEMCKGWFKIMTLYPKVEPLVLWALSHRLDFKHSKPIRQYSSPNYTPFYNGHISLSPSRDALREVSVKSLLASLRKSYKPMAVNKQDAVFYKGDFIDFFQVRGQPIVSHFSIHEFSKEKADLYINGLEKGT